jgi:hypothetical protein
LAELLTIATGVDDGGVLFHTVKSEVVHEPIRG